MTPRTLASTLISHAAGLTSDTAAAELICAHHTWLTRTDFTTSCIRAGTRHDGHPYAYIGNTPSPPWTAASSAAPPPKLPSCASPPASATTRSPSTSPAS